MTECITFENELREGCTSLYLDCRIPGKLVVLPCSFVIVGVIRRIERKFGEGVGENWEML